MQQHGFSYGFNILQNINQMLKTVPINSDLFPRFLYYVPKGERAGTEEPYRPTIRDYMHDETVAFVAPASCRVNVSSASSTTSPFTTTEILWVSGSPGLIVRVPDSS